MSNLEVEYKWAIGRRPRDVKRLIPANAAKYIQTYFVDTKHDAFYQHTSYQCFGKYPLGKMVHTYKEPIRGRTRTELNGDLAQRAWTSKSRTFRFFGLRGICWEIEKKLMGF